MTHWYEDNMKVLSDAMLKAKEAFDNYINDELKLDGAYWDLELTGYVNDSEFNRWKKLEMTFSLEEPNEKDNR